MNELFSNRNYTPEGERAVREYLTSLEKALKSRGISVEVSLEILDSICEHLEFSLDARLEMDYKTEVDGQVALETLFALGSVEEIADECIDAGAGDYSIEGGIDDFSDSFDSSGLSGTSAQGSDMGNDKVEGFTAGERISLLLSEKFQKKDRPRRRLLCKSDKDRWVSGVCGGLGEYFGISGSVIRFLFLLSGAGLMVYVILALLLPSRADAEEGAPSLGARLVENFARVAFLLIMCLLVYIPGLLLSLFNGFLGAAKVLGRFDGGGVGSYYNIGETGFFLSAYNLLVSITDIPGFVTGCAVLTASFCTGVLIIHLASMLHTRKSLLGRGGIRAVTAGLACAMAVVIWFHMTVKWHNSHHSMTSFRQQFTIPADSDMLKLKFREKFSNSPLASMAVRATCGTVAEPFLEVCRMSYGTDEKDALANAGRIDPGISIENGALEISPSISGPRGFCSNYQSVEYRVYLPAGISLEVIELPGDPATPVWRNGPRVLGLVGRASGFTANLGSTDFECRDFISDGIFALRLRSGKADMAIVKAGDLEISVNSGNVKASDIKCSQFRAVLKSGMIRLSRLETADLNMEVSSGMIEVSDLSLSGNSRTTVKSGSLDLDYVKAPAGTFHSVNVESGRVGISILRSLNPLVKSTVNSGLIDNDFEDASADLQGPEFRISVNSGMASISAR
jgi:phage shock protein C